MSSTDAAVGRQPLRRLAPGAVAGGLGLGVAFITASPFVPLAAFGLTLAFVNGYSKAYSP